MPSSKVVKTGTEAAQDISLFVAVNKKILTTSIKDINENKLDSISNKIIRFSKNLPKNPNYEGITQGPKKHKEISQTNDKKVLDLDEADLVQKGINKALEYSKRVSGVFETNIADSYLLTSNNIETEEKSTQLYFSIRALNNNYESGHMNSCSRTLNLLEVEEAAKLAGEIAKKAKNPLPGKEGKYDVVFSHMAFAPLLNNIAEAASIFAVESGLSFLSNQLNKKLGNFNLIDDATLPNGYNSTKYDAEGSPTQLNKIIDNGILKTYLHNTSTAKRYKVKTTANAGLISPDAFNIIFDAPQKDIFNIKKGIYVTNVWYTRFQNYHTGDFSTIPRDGMFLIENGKITKPIKNVRISDNILNIIANISGCNNNVKQLKSWEAETPVKTPEVLVKNVNITKPTD